MTRPKASKVKVTKADGTVEIRNAYNAVQLAKIRNEHPNRRGNPSKGKRHKRG